MAQRHSSNSISATLHLFSRGRLPNSTPCSCVALAGCDGGTLETARAAGGDEADLLAGRRVTAHRGGVADMLVVATTVGVLHWVHGHTTHLQM